MNGRRPTLPELADATALSPHHHFELCVIGSGAAAQAVATRASCGGLTTVVLEAGSSDRSRQLQHELGPAIPLVGTHAPDPSSQTSVRLGGSLDLPAILLDPTAEAGRGIRLTKPGPQDLDDRPEFGLPRWPVNRFDLEAALDQAAASFGLTADDLSTDLACKSDLPLSGFWCVDRTSVAFPDLSRFGKALVLVNAPVRQLEIDAQGIILCALVQRSDGSCLRVRADRFVVAAGVYESTRILQASDWAHAPAAANSSGLLGKGLMDHPQLVLGSVKPRNAAGAEALLELRPVRLPSTNVSWPMVVGAPRAKDVGLALNRTSIVESSESRTSTQPRGPTVSTRSCGSDSRAQTRP